jgi:hypothetical protein
LYTCYVTYINAKCVVVVDDGMQHAHLLLGHAARVRASNVMTCLPMNFEVPGDTMCTATKAHVRQHAVWPMGWASALWLQNMLE